MIQPPPAPGDCPMEVKKTYVQIYHCTTQNTQAVELATLEKIADESIKKARGIYTAKRYLVVRKEWHPVISA